MYLRKVNLMTGSAKRKFKAYFLHYVNGDTYEWKWKCYENNEPTNESNSEPS